MRMMVAVTVGVVCVACAVPSSAQDSAVVLARILAEKGIISKSDLARVESAGSGERAQALTQAAAPALIANAKPMSAPAPVPTTSEKPAIAVYGTVLWNSYLNTSLTNNADIPLFAGKQGSDPTGNDKNFGMTVRQSRLGVRYNGPQVGGARLSAVIESDFFGGQASLPNGIGMDLFRLRLAYGRMDWANASLIAGQDWSVYAPLNPASLASFAIPAMAGSGNAWDRTPQLRAEVHTAAHNGQSFLWQIAATDPNVGDYATGFATARTPTIGERGRLPGFDTRLAWNGRVNNKDASFGVSSHYSRGKNAGLIGSRSVQQGVDSWGVAIDYVLPVARRLTLTGEIFDGRALGIYSASLGQSVLPVGTPGAHGVGTAGGWTQAQFQLAPRWQANFSYGLETNEAANLRAGDRDRNRTVMSNVMYKLSPQFTVAGEWRRLFTDFYNQQPFNERGDHFNLAIGYIF